MCSMSVRVCELLLSVLYLMYIDCVKLGKLAHIHSFFDFFLQFFSPSFLLIICFCKGEGSSRYLLFPLTMRRIFLYFPPVLRQLILKVFAYLYILYLKNTHKKVIMQPLGKYTARHSNWRLVDSLVCWFVGWLVELTTVPTTKTIMRRSLGRQKLQDDQFSLKQVFKKLFILFFSFWGNRKTWQTSRRMPQPFRKYLIW